MRILLVENDRVAALSISTYLATEGFQVHTIDTGEQALEMLRHYEFDIVLLSLSLPDMEGSQSIRRLRMVGSTTPVLALCGTLSVPLRVKALTAGADDVVNRSVDQTELLARMQAIIRRSRGYSRPALTSGSLTLDLELHAVTVDGRSVRLTGREFEILKLLMLRKNTVMTKEGIFSSLYAGVTNEPEVKIIDVFICKLRKKLADAGAANVIGTVWGRGYIFREQSQDTNNKPYQPGMPTVPNTKHPLEHLLAA